MRLGTVPENIHASAVIRSPPRTKPSNGDSTIAMPILTRPLPTSECTPPLATAAPARPPISACDDDDGRPYHQVTAFQTMAPVSAPRITFTSTSVESITPVPIVLATLSPKTRNATKLKND